MQMSNPQTALTEIFCRVLEEFAFLFAEPVENEEITSAPGPGFTAKMTFSGPITGQITLFVPESLIYVIAANALGVEPEDTQRAVLAQDALKELLNITCGQLLTALAGETPVFHLSVPVVSRLEANAAAALPDAVTLLVDDVPVSLHITVSEGTQR